MRNRSESSSASLPERQRELQQADILQGGSGSGTVVNATYAAVEECFSEAAIKCAFKQCGLWPFSPECIRKLAAQYHGLDAAEPTNPDLCREAARAVIDSTTSLGKRKRTVSVDSPVMLRRIYSGERLLEQMEADEEAARDAKRQKTEDNARRTCRYDGCGTRSRGGIHWASCPSCSAFMMCQKHSKSGAEMLANHIALCDVPATSGACDEISDDESSLMRPIDTADASP